MSRALPHPQRVRSSKCKLVEQTPEFDDRGRCRAVNAPLAIATLHSPVGAQRQHRDLTWSQHPETASCGILHSPHPSRTDVNKRNSLRTPVLQVSRAHPEVPLRRLEVRVAEYGRGLPGNASP